MSEIAFSWVAHARKIDGRRSALDNEFDIGGNVYHQYDERLRFVVGKK